MKHPIICDDARHNLNKEGRKLLVNALFCFARSKREKNVRVSLAKICYSVIFIKSRSTLRFIMRGILSPRIQLHEREKKRERVALFLNELFANRFHTEAGAAGNSRCYFAYIHVGVAEKKAQSHFRIAFIARSVHF